MRLEDAINQNKSNHPILTAPLVLQGFCFLFQLVWTHPVCRSFFCLLLDRGRTGGSAWIASRVWNHLSPELLDKSVWSNWFFEREHPFIDKPMTRTEPLVPSAWLFFCSPLKKVCLWNRNIGQNFWNISNWFYENHLTKLAAICVKRRQKTGFLSPIRVRQAPKSH